MTSRFIALFSCGLALAVACGSDDDDKQPTPDDVAGAGGEAGSPPSSSAGSSTTPTAGSGGTSGSAGSSAGGEPSVAGAGAGGESSAAGASSEGGTPNQPEAPNSACGVGRYETGDGCTTCPAPPAPNDPTPLGCAYFDSAEKSELTLIITFADAPLHEPVAGESPVSWVSSDQSTGEASVPWQYAPATGAFTFDLPLDARYAVEFTFNGWVFTDACGFHFTAGALRVAEGSGGWLCALPL
jgi:hypothetical protein